MRALWAALESLDNQIDARTQYAMMYETSRLLRHATYWLLRERRRALAVDVAVKELRDAISELATHLSAALHADDASRLGASVSEYTGHRVPSALAERVAKLPWLEPAFDIVALARTYRLAVREAAALYFALSQEIGLGWLHDRIERLAVDGPWQAVARTGLRDNARRAHQEIAARVLRETRGRSIQGRLTAWMTKHHDDFASWQRTLTDMRASGGGDFATLSVGVEAVRALAKG
jgi:glutamate dehydrogenase